MKRVFVTGLGLVGLMSCIATAVAPTAHAALPAARHDTAVIISTARAHHWLAGPRIPNNFNGGCTGWSISGRPVGEVCITAESNGYNAEYYNDTTVSHYVDFNLVTDSNIRVGDQGAFWASPGTPHTYFFATGNLGCARVYVYARIEGWNIFSNDVSTAGFC